MNWIIVLLACGGSPVATDVKPTEIPVAPVEAPTYAFADDALRKQFAALPTLMEHATEPVTPEKVTLGRMLYYENRMSKNQDLSCNSCHLLDKYGVDNQPTSPGHKGQRGNRNSPTSYNAALHVAQFWDGRAVDVEAQAKGPVLNPIEMGMPSETYVVDAIRSIPGYEEPFKKAFPADPQPITYDNIARAIGAFERTLVTPSPFDAWLAGDGSALTPEQRAGLDLFAKTGCTACHNGVDIGGSTYQKVGAVRPYETPDLGRYEVTKDEADKYKFKVPSLRNVSETGPYFHDGKIATLPEAVKTMAAIQLGKDLTDEEVTSIVTFLKATTGPLPLEQIKKPELPPSGPNTPKPDPT